MSLSVPFSQQAVPTLIPAMAVTALFFNLTMGVGWRLRQHKFRVYGYLMAFCFLRSHEFLFRAAWAKYLNVYDFIYGFYLASQILANISQFLLLFAVFYALVNWTSMISGNVSRSPTRFIKFSMVGLPIFQLINIIASVVLLAVQQPSPGLIDGANKCRQAVTIVFLLMVVAYCLMVLIYYTRFAKSTASPKHFAILFVIGILLIVKFSYESLVFFEPLSIISQSELYNYLLDPTLEMIVVLIAICFNLEEIRYTKSGDIEEQEQDNCEMVPPK